jgi:ribonucleoside-diphosphate reductase alpha chain
MKNDLSIATFYDKYSRWIDELERFETLEEAVDRSIEHARYVVGNRLSDGEYEELRQGMLKFEAFPSMRWFQMAGPEAQKHPQAIFNCSFMAANKLEAFSEALFLLGLGVGVGYSVERKHVNQLPIVSFDYEGIMTVKVEDSLEGWAGALYESIMLMYAGYVTYLDVSAVRPAGARLKTRGGIASGPEAFVQSHNAIQDIIINARGRRLSPLEVHDIFCFIASAIVSGGVRRSAMIALFDRDDVDMAACKSPKNIMNNEQRYYANNSLVIDRCLEYDEMQKVMDLVFKNSNGEPGIFNRWAANMTTPARRHTTLGVDFIEYGTNPCGEVFLQDMQFCNLSIANVRPEDGLNDLLRKVRLAVMWGTIQAAVHNFNGLRPQWEGNQRRERLLGVDLNGVLDNEMFWHGVETKELVLEALKKHAVNINKLFAARFGIREATAVTCNKPAGNSSVFFDTASGIHPRFSKYYIRRITLSANSSLAQFLMSVGVECEPANGVSWTAATTLVFKFYVDASKSLTAEDVTTGAMLEHWLKMKLSWTEHNPSATIYYSDDGGSLDKTKIRKFMYDNQNEVSGITFLPKYENIWAQAPYEKISAEEYAAAVSAFPAIDWAEYLNFDQVFRRIGQEYACVGGACEL